MSARAEHRSRGPLIVVPAAVYLILFFTLPLLIVVAISFVERGRAGGVNLPLVFTFEYYQRLVDP
ncbi:MAG TPA: hypothetical protein VI729_01800, partial [Anaerolineales bacterium]|nr:hypothetical protein [Anaerolineales bacterium]